jgi:hypothetical protein
MKYPGPDCGFTNFKTQHFQNGKEAYSSLWFLSTSGGIGSGIKVRIEKSVHAKSFSAGAIQSKKRFNSPEREWDVNNQRPRSTRGLSLC